MNEDELDRLLDLWKAPAPGPSLRDGLRERLPRMDRLEFGRPLRWGLATLLACVLLGVVLAGTVAIAENSETISNLPVVRTVYGFYLNLLEARQAGRAKGLIARVAESQPKVFVDGRLGARLEIDPSGALNVQVPGEGVYSIIFYPLREDRTTGGRPLVSFEAGHIVGNVIEFRAGAKEVRIECTKPVVEGDRPVYAIRRR